VEGNVGIGTWTSGNGQLTINGVNLTSKSLVKAIVSDNITTATPLINVDASAVNAATDITVNQITTTSANDVNVVTNYIERGTNDAKIAYDEGLTRWQMDEGTGAGLLQVPLILDKVVTTSDITSSSAENTIYSFTVPQNTMTATGVLRLSMEATILNNTGGNTTITVRIKFGGTTMYDDVTPVMATSASRRSFRVNVYIANQNSVSAQILSGTAEVGVAGTATTGYGDFGTDEIISRAPLGGTAAVDTSAAGRLLDITVQASSSATTHSIRREFTVLELL
jgi:hypothetical protein